jgi:putative sulfotransferase
MDAGAIVLSTGRCGSTLLSELLAEHPEVASIQEFFAGLAERLARPAPHGWTGEEFWQAISRPSQAVRALHGIGRLSPGLRARLGAGARSAEASGLLAFTLPALTDRPAALLAELADAVPRFPRQSAGAHCRRLFALITARTGRRRWVERTGGSAGTAAEVLDLFPDALVIHLTRDCVDTAVSMSRMPYLVLLYLDVLIADATGFRPYRGEPYDLGQVPAEVLPLMPENLTAPTLDRVAASAGFRRHCVLMLAAMRQVADWALRTRPASRLLRVSYADLVSRPRETLARIGAFLDLPDRDRWAAEAARRVRTPATPAGVSPDAAERQHLHTLFDRMTVDGSVIRQVSTDPPDWLTHWGATGAGGSGGRGAQQAGSGEAGVGVDL